MASSSKIFSGIRAVILVVVSLALINLVFGEQKMCGSNLRNVIEMMCPNGVNGYKTKRSSLPLGEDFSIEDNEEDFNFGLSLDMLPFLMNEENNGIAKIRRRRHGIAHECCDKPCTTKEILSYCRV